ncbi:MAG: type II CRISPR RNA-guided endonuclease Cas9 [Andreesenia angusta]|nr:type II CRISPR RNA-guided endonuclease Cas9 [Andreesenia angusta]
MKQKFKDYYLGLDVGTSSVGWAVTDENYDLIRFNRKDTWGTRMYEEAETALKTRIFRSSRRRINRRKDRIKLVQELFAEEISKVDPVFFQKLKESKLHLEDREIKNKYTLFNEKGFTDKDYYKKYPTIFHLRKELIDDNSKKDIRLIYLAIHNIIKKRGNFLFEGQDLKSIKSLKTAFINLSDYFRDNFDIDIEVDDISSVEEILMDKEQSATNKVKLLKELFNTKDKQLDAAFKIMVGNKGNFQNLFNNENYKDIEYKDIKFKDINYDDNRNNYANLLNEDIDLVDILKSIYDWSILHDILDDCETLSESMVRSYERHRKELKDIKYLFRKYLKISDYNKVFRNRENGIYTTYIGDSSYNSRNQLAKKKDPSQENLCKKLEKFLKNIEVDEKDLKVYKDVMLSLERRNALPKQRVSNNGVIPYQLHKIELERILKNAERHYSFLSKKDENGLTVSEKLLMIIEFRIPYYIGPLNNHHSVDNGRHGNSWVVRKEVGKVLPWNFEEKIDIKESAEKFITRMTNKCSYLIGEDVLPKESILYSKFTVLNEINNMKIDGKPISVELKKAMFDEVFKVYKNVKIKHIRDFLKIKKIDNPEKCEISGIDDQIKSSMSSYIDFKKIFGDKLEDRLYEDIAEDSIRWKCLYGKDKKLLKSKLIEEYGKYLNEDEIKKITKLNYSKWGRLSKTLLKNIKGIDRSTGEIFDNIIKALYESNDNLMELLSYRYSFADEINGFNEDLQTEEEFDLDEFMDELYLSPSVRRAINQTIKIVDEIKSISEKDPKKIFIEMARGPEEVKKKKDSRKDQLIKIYKELDCKELYDELEAFDNERLRQRKLYLYFTQLGKCMYSGENINLSELFSRNIYDIDHIYPQSKVKDDSIDNLVLVKKELNDDKSDKYPIDDSIRKKMFSFWAGLKDKKLISKKKFNRLIRATSFTDDELVSFISRQLVETRQSTKAIGLICQKLYPTSEIIYVKSGLITDFRHKFDIIKSRDLNNFHHAHDAYLAIPIGNAYDIKFTKNPMNFIKGNSKERKYNIKKFFEFDVERNGIKAWDKDESIKTVKRNIKRPTVLITERTFDQSGQLFDATIQRKGKNKGLTLPIKSELWDISRYGYYNKVRGKYMFLVEHEKKKKRIRTLEVLPIYISEKINSKEDLIKFSKEVLELKEPKIIVERIPYRSKIEIDGFPYLICGKSNDSFVLKCSKALTLDEKNTRVLKDVSDYIYRIKENKLNYVKRRNDKETQEEANIRFEKELLDLYDIFIKRLDKNGPYENRTNTPLKEIKSGVEFFSELSIGDKCAVISEINKLFSRIPGVKVNLLLINGKESCGVPTIGKNFTNKDIYIINESATGLFSNRIKL